MNEAASHASLPERHARAAQFFEGAIRSKSRLAKVVLEHHHGVVSAPPVAADGVDAVSGRHHHAPAPILRRVANAAAHARIPVAGLLQAMHVIHERSRGYRHDVPLFGGAERNGINAISEADSFG